MAGRSRYTRTAPDELPDAAMELLRAIAAGHVRDESGEYTGVWAPYRLGGQDVGTEVRRLWHYGLIHKPLVGPPTLSAEGWARIDTEADPF
jgi:hypothetical protein